MHKVCTRWKQQYKGKHLNSCNFLSALLYLFGQFNVSWKPILVQVLLYYWQLGCPFLGYFSVMISFVKADFFFLLCSLQSKGCPKEV